MERWRNTLLTRVLLQVLPLALCGLLAILALGYSHTERALRESAQSSLRKDAQFLASEIRERIETLRTAVEAVAGNSLLINAMTDVEDRNHYLPLFIRSQRLPGVADGSVTLLDYRGRVIDYSGASPQFHAPAFAQAIKGESSVKLIDGRLVVAVPVRVNDTPDGVLSVTLGPSELERLLRVQGENLDLAVVDGAERVLAGFGSGQFERGKTLQPQQPTSSFQTRIRVSTEPPMELVVTRSAARALSYLQAIKTTNLITSAFVLFLLILGVVVTALSVTRPLSRLAGVLRTFGSVEDLGRRLESAGTQEFQNLAFSFNEMIERLEKTTISRDRVTGLLNSLKEMLLVTDAQGFIESANPTALAFIGCKEDDLLGRQITEIFLPRTEEESVSYLFAREAAKAEVTVEANCICHDGRKFPVMMSAAAIENRKSSSHAIVYTALDTSVVEQAKAAVVQLQNRLTTAIESMPEGFALYNNDEVLVLYNSKLRTLLPNSAEAINVGTNYQRVLQSSIDNHEYPEAIGQEEAFLADFQRLQNDPEATLELRLGSGKWLQVIERRTADGGIVGLYRDITQRKLREERLSFKTEALTKANRDLEQEVHRREKAERLLRKSEVRAKALFQAAPDGIVTIDAEGLVENANPAIGRMFGCDPLTLAGTSIRGLVPELFDSCARQSKQSASDSPVGRCNTIREMSAVRFNGEQLTVDVTTSRTSIEDQAVTLAIMRDSSERHKLQHLKFDLISTVSHELRTPMTSILGALELLEAGHVGVLPEKARDMASVACRACERMVGLLNDILDMEKISSDKIELQMEPVPLHDLLAEVKLSLEPLAQKAEVTIAIHDATDNIRLSCDWNRTIQIMTNLTANAIKFSPAHGIVRIEAEQKADFVRFTVQDQGEGVSPEFAARIFEPFSQAKQAARYGSHGTGLGLAISRRLVQAHGGTIGFTSHAGQGSCFYFELPIFLSGSSQEQLPEIGDVAL